MPAIPIEQAVRTMLTSNIANLTVPDASITHGYRLQDSSLPAITFSVDSTAKGSISADIFVSEATVTAIAATTYDVSVLQAAVSSACIAGSYGLFFRAVDVTNQSILPESVGMGDEQEPAQGITNITVHWSSS